MKEVLHKIKRAKRNLEFIDKLKNIIGFSKLYREIMKENMPLLAETYKKEEGEIFTIFLRTIPKSTDVAGLGEGKKLYERYEEECIDRLICTAMITT